MVEVVEAVAEVKDITMAIILAPRVTRATSSGSPADTSQDMVTSVVLDEAGHEVDPTSTEVKTGQQARLVVNIAENVCIVGMNVHRGSAQHMENNVTFARDEIILRRCVVRKKCIMYKRITMT